MTERGFHPFAVLHFLRKTILLYLLPLLQVLFARNWAALRTALVQGAVLLAVIAAVSAAVLHTSRWQVDEHGTLRVCWRRSRWSGPCSTGWPVQAGWCCTLPGKSAP